MYDEADFIVFFLAVRSAVRCKAPDLREKFTIRSRLYGRYLGNNVTYTCKDGYSFTPENANDQQRTVGCQANGTFRQLRPSHCEGETLF